MRLICLLALTVLLAFPPRGSAAEPLSVYTVNYPQAYFAERIGGDQVEVAFPAPADVDPAYWMPDQATIAAYQQADLILLNGANYAKWIGKVSLPRSKVVDTSRKFRDRYLYASEVATHSHGAAGEHAHESLAFTTWLDLSLAKLQAEAIYTAFLRKQPSAEMAFKKNYRALVDDLGSLDAQIRKVVAKDPAKPLLGSHPVYDYLSTGYGLNLQSVHWEPDAEPTSAQWNELHRLLETHPARHMLWEGEPLPEVVSALEGKGIESVVFCPSANRPTEGDFISMMKSNVRALEVVYR